jgi:hypothetical protein
MSKIKKSISPGLETVRLSYENNFMIEKCDLAEHMQISQIKPMSQLPISTNNSQNLQLSTKMRRNNNVISDYKSEESALGVE